MFDFHMHSTVSFDGHSAPEEMVKAAVAAGLREVCFTDHLDSRGLKNLEKSRKSKTGTVNLVAGYHNSIRRRRQIYG